jgi:plastocyanin
MSAGNERREDRGLTQLAVMFAVLLSMASLLAVAFKLEDSNKAASAVAAVPSESLKLVIKTDEEHGKMGSDGNWHDAFLPADFSVKAGATVRVTVYNYDDMPHSFNSAELGTNVNIAAGSEEKPSETTFTIKAPAKPGSYAWYCALPCDPWAMAHDGFMRGRVTVV